MAGAGAPTIIDYPGAGNVNTRVGSINDRDDFVGRYDDATGQTHVFCLCNGSYTTVDPPGAVYAQEGGINNAGQITGTYSTDGNNSIGFVRDGPQ